MTNQNFIPKINRRIMHQLTLIALGCSITAPSHSTDVAAVYADFINPLIMLPDENPPVDEATSATFFSGHIKYSPAADGTPTEPNDGAYWLAESAFGQLAASTFSPQIYTITPSANPPAGGTFTPSGVQTATQGATKVFTVAANTGYVRSNTVSGTCPQGTWNGNVWTTGAITASCTVIFNFTGGPQLPTCITNAATNVTVNSATLNGNVTSAGTTATASFEFGTSTSYGETVAATPSQIYSSTAVAVSATKTGLACNTAYNFRTKAVSNTGTGTGANQTFTTSACAANSWLTPPNSTVPRDQPFTLAVVVKSDGMKVSNYEFAVSLDPAKLQFDTAYQNAANTCYLGVCPGTSALLNRNVVDTNLAAGTVVLTGQDATGQGPGNDLQLLVIHFKTKTTVGATPVNLVANKLANPSGGTIGLVTKGAIVNVSYGLCGDADGNNAVNIVDALAVARKVAGLTPPPTVDTLLGDVDKNTILSISDALHIARHSVGLVLMPELCTIGLPL